MMQIEGIVRAVPQPHLEIKTETRPEGALIVMLGTLLFKQKAERKGCLWTLELPAEAFSLQPLTAGGTVEIWLAPEVGECLTRCPQALQEALLANRSACYFFQLLDPWQRERIMNYAEQGAEEQRIRRIDKIIAMLYERRTL